MSDQVLIDALNKIIKTQDELIQNLKEEIKRLKTTSIVGPQLPTPLINTPWVGAPVTSEPWPNYPGVIPGINPTSIPNIEPGNPYYSTSGYVQTMDKTDNGPQLAPEDPVYDISNHLLKELKAEIEQKSAND